MRGAGQYVVYISNTTGTGTITINGSTDGLTGAKCNYTTAVTLAANTTDRAILTIAYDGTTAYASCSKYV